MILTRFVLIMFFPTWMMAQDPDSTSGEVQRDKNAKERFLKIQNNFYKRVDQDLHTQKVLRQLQDEQDQKTKGQSVGEYTLPQEDRSQDLAAEKLMLSVSEIEFKHDVRIHGPSQFDSRIEIAQLDPGSDWQSIIIKKSESIGMIVKKEQIKKITQSTYLLNIEGTLGSVYKLCKDQAFVNQPIAGRGTAFIYSEDTMMTAAHVFEGKISDYAVIFGYQLININGVVENFFDDKNVYFPTAKISEIADLDVVQFKVDRPFDRPALVMGKSLKLSKNQEIYMLGHPNGLPLKLAINANVEEDVHQYYFYTSLDGFQGNSGSPVFAFETNEVIGVLVSGELDYEFTGECFRSPLCRIPYCKGEKVMRISEIVKRL